LKRLKDFYPIYFWTWLELLFRSKSQVKSSHFQKSEVKNDLTCPSLNKTN
jgi:hypothetical protein